MKFVLLVKTILDSPERFKSEKTKKIQAQPSKHVLNGVIVWANSFKHYFITICFFLVFFMLDFLKNNVPIPDVNYKLILLYFYCGFLLLTAAAQVILEMVRLEGEMQKMYHKMMEKS